jgi:branched-chain amino acid transport system permease protein
VALITGFEPFMADALVYGSLFAFMSMGLTLTYVTTRVPNFAHGSFVTVGVYLAFTLYQFEGISPYFSAPFSFLLVGSTAIAMYRLVLKPLSNRGSSLVSLMIATLAIDIAFVGIFGIYSDLLSNVYRVYNSKFFLLSQVDITLFDLRGLTFIAPISLALITLALWLMLTRTKFGIAMRAAVENPNLAGVLGINIERVYLVSWFLAGGLAGIGGSFVVLWLPGSSHIGSDLIVNIFAASILGGLFSVYGAVIGGLLVGGGEILVTVYAARLLGSWAIEWQAAVPMLIMALSLIIVPQGITSVKWSRVLASLRRRK